MKSLHKSLLEKYNSAAKSYYTSLLGQYHPPSLLPSKDDDSLLTLLAYTSKAMQQLPIQEWKVDSNSITQWFHQPLKDILVKHYKKEELGRKLQGLKDQHLKKHALQQQGVNDKQQSPTNNELKDANANIGQEKLPQEETKKSTKQEIPIADSKEHDASVVADDEDVISSPSQDDDDADDAEAGEESEIDEGHDENDGTEEDEDGSPGEDGETQSDDHVHTPTTEVVKKIAMKSNKKSSSALPPAGDSVMKNPRQNIKNNNNNNNNNNTNNNTSNSSNHQNQNQPGQNKRKKEITGNASSAAGTKKKKRSNRGRGRPGRGRGK
jgi:hypothetical protein